MKYVKNAFVKYVTPTLSSLLLSNALYSLNLMKCSRLTAYKDFCENRQVINPEKNKVDFRVNNFER
jgi:hypothetical protein